VRLVDKPTRQHEQFKHAERLRLGAAHIKDMELRTLDLGGNRAFSDIVEFIKAELGD